jgi:hypothetical protein
MSAANKTTNTMAIIKPDIPRISTPSRLSVALKAW